MGKGLREYLAKKNGERQVPLSALFLYYEERVMMGTVNQDSGATITDGMDVLSHTGIATEETWSYDITQFKIKPPAAAYSSAGEFKVHDATQLESFDDVKTALAKGQPVAFGFRVYDSFRKIGADGVMPVPAAGERLLGGHAVLAVGYDDAKKSLIVRNSWSDKWGDHGYFYMPYAVANSAQARDFWTASK
jgi:C1A family cysteine protease